MDARTVGALIGAIFGSAWGIAGASGLPERQRWTMPVIVAVSAAVVTALLKLPAHGPAGTFRGEVYGIAVTLESVGIAAAVWALRRYGYSSFLMPAVGFIVGLHFIGLWRATDLSMFAWVAVGMCLVCGAAALVPPGGNADRRRVVAGLGCALILWIAALTTIL